jgi:two-component system chemotaxis response regulator CheB
MIHLLYVDPDATRSAWLGALLEASGFRIVGRATSGEDALTQAGQCQPQVALICLRLPDISGAETTRQIMEHHPVPVVLLVDPPDLVGPGARESARCGATAIIETPPAPEAPGHLPKVAALVKTLRLMHEIPVVKRKTLRPHLWLPRPAPTGPPILIGLAASTGGPAAVQFLLQLLPREFPVPLLLVQHMSDGFSSTLVEWLRRTTPLKVEPAEDGVAPQPGTLYVAADQKHVVVRSGPVLTLEDGEPVQGHRPSANIMLESLARTLGPRAVGIVLTGMGDDGAEGLLELRRRGGLTYAQDEQSCVVYGMPREAVRRGAVQSSMSLAELAEALQKLAGPNAPDKEKSP